MSGEGLVGGKGESLIQAVQSAADWYDTLDVTIGADDIDLKTAYPGFLCKGVQNIGSASATIKYRTNNDMADEDQTIVLLNQGDYSGKQPVIRRLRGSDNGTTSGAELKLYFQRRG